jgi:hypothetical protein
MLDTDENPNKESKYKDTLIVEQMTDLRNYRILVDKLNQELKDCKEEIRIYSLIEDRFHATHDKIETKLVKAWSNFYHKEHQN